MADYPALPLWTDAFLADTTHLTRDEIGAYMLLLMTAWRRPDCDLPDDDAFLARVARCDIRAWRSKLRARMLEFHDVVDKSVGNSVERVWRQKRLRKERTYVEQTSARMRDIALARWNNNKDLADAPALLPLCYGDAPTPIPTSNTDRTVLYDPARAGKKPPQSGNGYGAGSVTIASSDERIARFQASLVPVLGPTAWDIINSACDPTAPSFAINLARCKAAAKRLNKGWPRQWPRITARAAP